MLPGFALDGFEFTDFFMLIRRSSDVDNLPFFGQDNESITRNDHLPVTVAATFPEAVSRVHVQACENTFIETE